MLLPLLEKFWGYKTFRKNQLEIITSILEGKDTVVVLPTGGGKSLCYQLPAIAQEGTAIVVSPLIALMKEQVDFLKSTGIEAEFVNSSLSRKSIQAIKNKIEGGVLKMLYIAPETLNKEGTIEMLKKIRVSFIAIDEAHCISDWGHDFRPEYRKLRKTINQIGEVPIIALTATATLEVRKDIVRNLGMRAPNVFVDSFDRPNLSYTVKPKINVEKKIVQFIKTKKEHVGIIYCQKKKEAEEIAHFLINNQIKAAVYHAGLDDATRSKAQDDFLQNKIDVIVATIAFGMGIDKPNIRFIIHHSVSRSLESYYQQTGRAGRDGNKSHCLLFYDSKDITKLDGFNKNKPIAEKKKLQILLREVESYAMTGLCRRQQILHYFGEPYTAPCDNCDNCWQPVNRYEGQTFVQQLLGTIQAIHERYDDDYITAILAGVSSANVVNNNHHKLPFFGRGNRGIPFWKSVLRQAFLFGFITRDIEEIANIKLTDTGFAFLKKPQAISLYKDRDYSVVDDDEKKDKDALIDKMLLDELQTLVEQQAKKHNIKPYLIFQQKMLENMAMYYPTSVEKMAAVPSIGLSKAKKFGLPFVKHIAAYVNEHNITPVTSVNVRPESAKYAQKKQLIQYIDRKIPLKTIAKMMTVSHKELIAQLEQLSAAGIRLNLKYHINTILTPEQQEDLYAYFSEAEEQEVQAACHELEDDYTEEQVRLMQLMFLFDINL